jgi:hypothetical protein
MVSVRAQRLMTKIKLISIFLLLIVIACSESHGEKAEISGTATAIRKSDGTIETRDASKKEKERLKQSLERHSEIDENYPGPLQYAEIRKLQLYEVKSVNSQGVIALKDGPDIILEGVKCDFKTKNYLAKLLSTEDDRIAFIPSSNRDMTPIPSYVWHADLSIMKDPELKDFIKGPSYSALNETALTSGRCLAEKTKTHKYYERYKALEEFSATYGPKRQP